MRNFLCESWVLITVLSVVIGLGGGLVGLLDIISGKSAKNIAVLCVATALISGIVHFSSSKVVNVVGMTIDNAIQTLQSNGFDVLIEGENIPNKIVFSQLPEKDIWVQKGTKIILNSDDIPDPTPAPDPTPSPNGESGEKTTESNNVETKNLIKISNNQILGQFNNSFSQQKYSYVATVTGKHRFDFDIDNVEYNYKFSISDSKGNSLKNTSYRVKGTTVELNAGNTYTITITKDEGNPKYTICIGSPQPTRNISGNQIVGSINYTDQEDTYTYIAPITGIYGLKFEISDVQKCYGYAIRDSKNANIKNGNSSIKQTYVELEAGEIYNIKITQKEGEVDYKVSLGIPNDVTYINSNSINGSITYYKQENCYIFTPSYTGEHVVIMSINDVKKKYSVKIVDDVNATVRSTNSASKESKVDLVAGKTYKIYVSYYEGECDYSIIIS